MALPSREQAAVCVVLGRSMDGNGNVFKDSFVCVLALSYVLFCFLLYCFPCFFFFCGLGAG